MGDPVGAAGGSVLVADVEVLPVDNPFWRCYRLRG
jgi:hypothetical protein